ncbi:MAG: heme-binding protein [Planctomycetota bacterium]|nr:heme-binding protein [Planctomycetota bacterium]
MELRKEFSFTSVSRHIPPTPGSNLLGPLAVLKGTWMGQGFNQIWRPFQGGPAGQDRFLELNQTLETLQFEEIPGDIPNRGFLQSDINLHGLRYLQQVQDANVLGPNGELAGIHVEHGMWLAVPPTTNPDDPTIVARLATIPHGTSLVAQGTSQTPIHGPPNIDPVSIAPFGIGTPPPVNTTITPAIFPERDLSLFPPTPFRTDAGDIPNVTQDMVDNPNTVLVLGLAGKTVISTVMLKISTVSPNPTTAVPPATGGPPTSGGGISNIAFLQGSAGGPNASAVQMDAIFFIETLQEPDGKIKHQLQYSQKVLLNFNGLSWPHVSVATLIKQ